MLNRLVEASLRYKFLVLIAFGVVAFLGWRAIYTVPIDAFPDVTPAQVNIYTESPGLAAEDVEHHIEIVVAELHRSTQFGDIPGPELVWTGGQQFRLAVGGMTQLISSFSHLLVLVQYPIHGAPVTEIGAFIQQCGIDLPWTLVLKALAVECRADRFLFGVIQ